MVNGPPCSTCGYGLRWFADQNAWGCDRCQKLFPVSSPPSAPSPPTYAPPGGPQPTPPQAYSPFPVAPPATAVAAPKKSKKSLYIGLGIVGLALAGGIIALVVLTGGKGGGRSRDAVIRETFAALSRGDTDALYRLADPATNFARIAKCKKLEIRKDDEKDPDYEHTISESEAEFRDPKKIEARWKKDIGFFARRSKGAKLVIAEIVTDQPAPFDPKKLKKVDDDDEDEDREKKRGSDRDDDDDDDDRDVDKDTHTRTIRQGKKLGKGCTARQAFRTQEVKVEVNITEGERELTQRVKLTLEEIDGAWYLTMPPALNVGFDIITKDLEDFRDQTCKCKDAPCIEKLEKDVNSNLKYAEYLFDRDSDYPKDAVEKMEKVQKERKECEATAKGGEALAKVKAIKETMCACKDYACAEKVSADLVTWSKTADPKSSSTSAELTAQMSAIMSAYTDCYSKLMRSRVSLDSAYPSSGPTEGGTYLVLHGSGFTGTPRNAKVYFGATEGTVIRFSSDNELIVQAPAGTVDTTVDIKVVLDPGGELTLRQAFSYRAP